ncbi:MAG: 4Fe-4S binding protein [Erysipelothrix sp.]|nr:4Fe-4S binding protein [Erysipelothrix sp.]
MSRKENQALLGSFILGKAFCDESICIDCGACISVCPTQAIFQV